VSRGSNGRETQEIGIRGNQVCFGWANKPERNSDRLTRQWWLWFPAAGHQTTPLTFGHNKMKRITTVGMLFLIGCSPMMRPAERVASPSGTFVVAAISNESKSDPTKYRCIRLILEHRNGNSLSAVQTGTSDDHKWAVGWMPTGDIVVLQSSDIGTQAFTVQSNALVQTTISTEIEVLAKQLEQAKYGR
jgi:hypothetical protein